MSALLPVHCLPAIKLNIPRVCTSIFFCVRLRSHIYFLFFPNILLRLQVSPLASIVLPERRVLLPCPETLCNLVARFG